MLMNPGGGAVDTDPPVHLAGRTESRAVVGFEVILGAYSPLSMAAMVSVSLSGQSSAMDDSDR
jgi:hypothetical protein